MNKIILVSVLACLFFSCNAPDKKILSEEETLAQKKQENDSLMIVFDSLMQIKVPVPQLVDTNIISAECLECFNRLARETGGEIKILTGSKLVTKNIVDIINDHAADDCDLMMLIDKTSSMEDDLDNIKKGLGQILNALKGYQNIRLSVGLYGDKNVDGSRWYDFKNFEKDFDATGTFIKNIKMTHGGDFPESVYDGIYTAFQENFWSSDSKRMVILIGDAPSLDSTLSTHRIEEILALAKKDKVNMNFYPIVLSPNAEEFISSEELRMEKIKLIDNLYPNPSAGLMAVELKNPSDLTLEIIDQQGKIIRTWKPSGEHEKVDLYDLPNGLYILRAFDHLKNFDEKKFLLSI